MLVHHREWVWEDVFWRLRSRGHPTQMANCAPRYFHLRVFPQNPKNLIYIPYQRKCSKRTFQKWPKMNSRPHPTPKWRIPDKLSMSQNQQGPSQRRLTQSEANPRKCHFFNEQIESSISDIKSKKITKITKMSVHNRKWVWEDVFSGIKPRGHPTQMANCPPGYFRLRVFPQNP